MLDGSLLKKNYDSKLNITVSNSTRKSTSIKVRKGHGFAAMNKAYRQVWKPAIRHGTGEDSTPMKWQLYFTLPASLR